MELKTIYPASSDFQDYILNNWYYVDKSLLIQKIEESGPSVCLFARPRRFGKSLNLSMLRYYYEDTLNAEENQARKALFDGLLIQKATPSVLDQQCAYPVIYLSFQAGSSASLSAACAGIRKQIQKEFCRHIYVQDHIRYQSGKESFTRLVNGIGTNLDYAHSLLFLTEVLSEYHRKRVILLIDDYDAPVVSAYQNGYLREMSSFMTPIVRAALKENLSLHRAILTGRLPIACGAIFHGLDNIYVNSVLGSYAGEYFGFTQEEVDTMLSVYNLEGKRSIMKEWYGGYTFCKKKVYNPFSVMAYIGELIENPDAKPLSYWSAFSSNLLLRKALVHMRAFMTNRLESLMDGKSAKLEIREVLNLRDPFYMTNVVNSMLLFFGYLSAEKLVMVNYTEYAFCSIPNEEVRRLFEREIKAWTYELD